MADALRTPSLERLLTALIKSVDEFSDRNDPQDCADKLHMLVSDLEDVTSDLKSCSSDWKAATGEAEESKKQQAEMKLELEQRREKMDEEEERLRRREVELEKRESELEKKERLFKQRNADLEKKEQLLQQQIGNVSTGLEELSAKFQQFQPSTNEALQLRTVALSKARGDAALQQSIRRFEANKAKRGMGPISPEKPVSKHRRQARQSSVGAAEMLTTFGPPEPLPEDIAERIPSPRGLGRVFRAENTRPEVGSPPPIRRRTGTSGGLDLLDSSTGSQTVRREQASSSMDPTTATEQTASEHAATSMPAPSSLGTLLQSSQSTVSATAPKGLEEASDEVKDVWRQIEFPENWDLSASDMLLRGLRKNIGKGVPKHFRPAGLLDSSSAKPNCVLRRLHKISSKIDNEDGKRCSTCKKFDAPCTQACFVTADLAKVAYNAQGQEKRWKLKIRED